VAPSFGSYIAGCLALIGIVAALGLGGYWLRRWIVPEFTGALARLADATLAIALFVVCLQVLGSLSALYFGWIVVLCVGVGLGAAWLGRSKAADQGREVAAPQVETIAFLIALGVASWAVAEWTFPTQSSLDFGMFGGDTTWYHMPFSAFIAQEHSTVPLHYTDPLRLAPWFYPACTELINAATIVLFKSDWLAPLQNLVWLPIALLAAWCIGRPYKVGPATLVAAAIILSSGVMIETQPGEARNDIMGLAFLLAFAAFLINGHQRRAPVAGAVEDAPERNAPLLDKGPLVMAGIAAGLAASVKFTFLVPVAAITVGVVLFSGRGRRWTTTWVMGLPLLVVGGYWYLRALVKTGGNPIPITKFGPLNLPKPDQMPLDPRPRFAVADYLTEPTIYRRWFFPKLEDAFGPLWPLILIIAAAAAVYIAWRSRNKILRVIAVASLLTAVVYVFTPLTAAGQEGTPTGFFTNTRYLAPGLILALVLLPIARPLRAPDQRAWQTLLFLTGLYAITVLTTPRWFTDYVVGAVFLTLCLVWAPAALSMARTRLRFSRAGIAAGTAVVVLLAVVLGRAQQVQYAEQHYVNPDPFLGEGGPKQAYVFTQKLRDKRIGIIGSSQIIFGQYGFYGNDVSNHVEFVGVKGPHGANRLPVNCKQLREQVNVGDYDYLVLSQYTQDTGPYNAGVPNPYQFPVYAWVKGDPAVELVVEDTDSSPQPTYVFKVNGELDAAACKPEERPHVPGEFAPE